MERAEAEAVSVQEPAWRGSGRPPQARYRRPPASLRALALAAGSEAGAAGDCDRTVPGVWLAETWGVIAPTAKPAVVSAASAACCD